MTPDPELRRDEPPGDSTVTMVMPGATLGPYRIESKLGQGGMGEVFRAVDTRLGRAVAIKTMHERFSARFEREARAIASLNHPHICTLHDVGPNYLVMELVEGETIAARLKRGPLPPKTALLYARQIAAALVEAHGKGITHRDLKPGNVMIAKSGVKVLDFGLAKSRDDETLTAAHAVMGTPAYMAPEQREGKPADARSDIYAFACVLYEMVTGARSGHARKRMPSRTLERIVNRCLEEDPGRRWQSAVELERELEAADDSRWKRAIPVAAAVVLLLAGAYVYFHRAPKLTDRDTIVLADFKNSTGDPVFDETLRQGLSIQLEQSPYLSLISDERVQRTLRLMGQPSDARLTPELARDVCQRTASAAVLEGSIVSLGSQYVLGLRATNCRTGEVLDEEQARTAKKEDVLDSLSQIASRFRTRAGESLSTIKEHATPLEEVTTPSLEALQAYSMGRKAVNASAASAVPYFQRATGIDPQFAVAYAWLGRAYSDSEQRTSALEATTKAWRLRDHASDEERFFIDFSYQRLVLRNVEKARQTLQLWSRTYPRVIDPHAFLGASTSMLLGKFEEAAAESQKALELDPDDAYGYVNLDLSYVCLNRLPEAEEVLKTAADRKVEIPEVLADRYSIAFVKGDQQEMQRLPALAEEKYGAGEWIQSWMSDRQGDVLAYSGHLKGATAKSLRAVEIALQAGRRESASQHEAGVAVREALFGNALEAQRAARATLQLSDNQDAEYGAALALALSGETARTLQLADDLDKRSPEDTIVQLSYLPVLRAAVALNRGDPSKALELLQAAAPYELGHLGVNSQGFVGSLYPIYMRGEAYLGAKRGAEAAAEFQKILDHRGIVVADPIGALAHLEIGRAYHLAGDANQAKAAYHDLLMLWKDADPDIPILKQAKTEYSTLQ
ncbi:MAG TPA: protein kinase [Bryobacteraceae bacterium]